MNGENLVGTILGNRYEILEIIGIGGMATVYKAKCHLLNRYVAVKVLKETFKDDPEIVRRFNSESQAAASLSHHNIVSIYDVGCEKDINYIVMEYVEGITLKEYIQKKKRLDWHEACQFAIQIGLALDHAHSKNIVHRDIKPHNILMTHDMTLKVTDFGIARAVSSETMVMGGAALGSVHYISPEQARGGYTDARSDIYSLGVVLYEMLTGTLPFDGDNAVSIAVMHINSEPRDIREINPAIPENLAKIVMKAIAKEQHARYQTAMEMITDLRAVLNASHIREDADDATKRIIIPEQETVSAERNGRMRKGKKAKKPKTPQQKKEDKMAVILAAATVLVIAVIAFGTYFIMRGGSREVQVPDLSNKTLQEAQELIKDTDFTIDEAIEEAYSDEFEIGKIISQDPGANQSVKKNTVIKVVVSKGKSDGDIDVPDVVGIDYKDAITKLADQDLDYKIVQEESSTEINQVLRQSPKSGTKVNKNDVVTLYVSSGGKTDTAKIPVPNVIGKTKSEAENMIKSAGLLVGNVSKEYSEKTENTVIAQNPAGDSESPSKSYVNIVLSKGPNPEQPQQTEKPVEPTVSPTKAPVENNPPADNSTVKTLTLQLPQNGAETVHVKVVANGKTIHDEVHQTSEGVVHIPVKSSKDASVQAYFDGELVVEKVIKF